VRVARADLETCSQAGGLVVVIDVLRAFTTAAFAFAGGAAEILPVATVAEALRLRAAGRADLAMGEVGGAPIPHFDLANSPAVLDGKRLDGARVAFRTTHGTQGVERSSGADAILVASFVVAGATAAAVLRTAPAVVTLVITGTGPDGAEEDLACADYLTALLTGEEPDPEPYLRRARFSATASRFLDPAWRQYPPEDLPLCLQVDRFGFAMGVVEQDGVAIMRPRRP
jgi:2-phosphosulfolactate phosphatase